MSGFWRRNAARVFWLFVILVLAGALLVMPRRAAGQDGVPTFEQMVGQGQTLAERLCRGCHITDDASNSTATVGVPSFPGIANRAGQSAERIRNVLIVPHPPMPDVQRSNAEINRLLAYLESLRAPATGAPLFPRASEPPKPRYPDPT